MRVVIMAGGKGTRIEKVARDIPKPMICICGKPILEHQISCLSEQGLYEITIVVGHLGHVIKDYFEDGRKFGVKIDYIEEATPLGTAGALYYLKNNLKDDFLLINGDIIFDIDIKAFLNYHIEKGAWATLLTHANSHPYDSGIIISEKDGRIKDWLHKEDNRFYYKNRVNAGIHIISPKLLESLNELKKLDLDRDILKPMIPTGNLFSYDSPEYIKDMGTPDRYQMVVKDIENGIVKSKNLKRKQKAIFLDRDGTINRYNGFINKHQDLELLEGAAEAISIINDLGYLAIVITNQPIVARGECTEEKLQEIHNKLETLLGEKGAYLDAIYYCPHHPDKGFQGERIELKIECDCRKPKPGMIYKATKKFNIDINESYMVGDSIIDVEAGKTAGCKVSLLDSENKYKVSEDIMVYSNLLEFVKKELLQKEKYYGYYTDTI